MIYIRRSTEKAHKDTELGADSESIKSICFNYLLKKLLLFQKYTVFAPNIIVSLLMSNISQLVDLIEAKTVFLKKNIEALKEENESLKQCINGLLEEKKECEHNLSELKKQNDALKVANRILGSKEHKTETKQKINALIREIDACIAQLSK